MHQTTTLRVEAIGYQGVTDLITIPSIDFSKNKNMKTLYFTPPYI